jgi:N-acetylglucosamine kinase-like BadF-type ATPase
MDLVLGVDAGGTSTRALLATVRGEVVARGTAAGGNPIAIGHGQALRALDTALREVLVDVDPATVAHAVIGMAGDRSASTAALDSTWRALGLTCGYDVVGDALVAFAGATPARSGTVLIAGTGAIAVRVEEGALADCAGGLGWLLGDEGGGFWFGRAAVRTAVAAVRRGRPTKLSQRVVTRLLGHDSADAGQLIVAAYDRPPLQLAELAPLVFEAAADGDAEADLIIGEAAEHLDVMLRSVQHPDPSAPVVFAGSCLGNALLRDRVAGLLTAPALVAASGEAGAAWLASVHVAGPSPAVHALLTGR